MSASPPFGQDTFIYKESPKNLFNTDFHGFILNHYFGSSILFIKRQ